MTCVIVPSPGGFFARRARTRLLRRTSRVRWRSLLRLVGVRTTLIPPLVLSRILAEEYARSPVVQSPTAYGPAQRRGRPAAFAVVIASREPLGVTSTSVGFQAVGMNPIFRRRLRSMTAIAFSPPSA